ncbi:hydrogen peroxide-inducible genes activator [Sulfitobacter donghicola]|uniref:LysR family transcriptional regulator n=1 Tax=Sulfitobacter donghicola DSW-25 = KCTC 12864 = JCM 14565 TaxID=1300350 RepID=A0A073IK79_9RHOB|nr:hydrogen peroxide-inducible genes activator [Sulfitobacter donghicola]KEJ90149.1 LysR family transcriptional regulator [Sulfitobacter donghicola DSW-25 = KCTC 12864 = JCM 14565]KIN66694.1 Transcriptional regulator, LysR family [Sulfitobacter donghicola DSW-25 = KCTC 12864 = JCM 14565]
MINFTLKQLRYFEAVALQGHFGRAADTCSISQPALSAQIAALEAALGLQLFERNARHVQLTPFGEEFEVRAREILRNAESLSEMARGALSNALSRLRIGVIPTIAPYLLPSVIGHITAAHPEIDLLVRETMTHKLIEELGAGKLDCAIVALPVSEPSLTEVALFDEEMVLVRPAHDADRPVPDMDTLSQMKLLLLEEGHCFRDQALSFCSMRNSLPREGLDGSSLTTLVQMVGAGIGVTLIPEMAVPVETRSANVAVANMGAPHPKRTVGMVWRSTSGLASQLEEIATLVRAAAATHPAFKARP